MNKWKLARCSLTVGERTLVMGILNVTPDSFSDGGKFLDPRRAVEQAGRMIAEGADIIDIGGESTRPGSAPVSADEEISRVVPVVRAIAEASRHMPLSVDTTKAAVARAALDAGAQIINDISGLRFDPALAGEVAREGAGLVLMHSRGTHETLHKLDPVPDIFDEVTKSLRESILEANRRGVARECIALDPGIGFGKSQEQNLSLIARLDALVREFPDLPMLIGTSRKSFIRRILDDAPANDCLHGTMATVIASVLRGAAIVRVHDVQAAVQTVRVADAIKKVQNAAG